MMTREIPREEWAGFLDGFSRMHEGWLVTLEVMGAEIGDQEEAHELRLRGVTAEADGGGGAIEIMIGDGAPVHVTRSVARPARVLVAVGDAGAHGALEIESEDGTKTLLRFRDAVLPEFVDALA
jgi:hypothetical protein